tara:strand:- start:1544 stop:1927 length:384 start_codon:yes stop_codon:yes gene_type:complete
MNKTKTMKYLWLAIPFDMKAGYWTEWPRRRSILYGALPAVTTSESETAASGAVGWCDPESQTIVVSNDQPMNSMQDTFLHEVLQAIRHVMGMSVTETEENYVRRLATGLCTVWNNNPAAFRWWSGLV